MKSSTKAPLRVELSPWPPGHTVEVFCRSPSFLLKSVQAFCSKGNRTKTSTSWLRPFPGSSTTGWGPGALRLRARAQPCLSLGSTWASSPPPATTIEDASQSEELCQSPTVSPCQSEPSARLPGLSPSLVAKWEALLPQQLFLTVFVHVLELDVLSSRLHVGSLHTEREPVAGLVPDQSTAPPGFPLVPGTGKHQHSQIPAVTRPPSSVPVPPTYESPAAGEAGPRFTLVTG